MKLFNIVLSGVIALSASSAMAEKKKSEPLKPIKEVFEPNGNFPANKFWKVAVVQWNPHMDAPLNPTKAEVKEYKADLLKDIEAFVAEAAENGAKYVSFSEFATIGYPNIPELPSEEDNFRNRDDIKPHLETLTGQSAKAIKALAKKHKVWIQYGSAEADEKTDDYYNIAVVVNDKGEVVAKYRKQELFELENDYLKPGRQNVVFETPAGKFGLLICADVYNYNVLGRYRQLQVDVLSLSTSWAEMNTGMKYFKDAARYVDAYFLAANQTYFPDSGVINRNGTTQSHIRQTGDAIAYGYLPLKSAE